METTNKVNADHPGRDDGESAPVKTPASLPQNLWEQMLAAQEAPVRGNSTKERLRPIVAIVAGMVFRRYIEKQLQELVRRQAPYTRTSAITGGF
jgi:hypothetical protein